jgi:hypothetical protein
MTSDKGQRSDPKRIQEQSSKKQHGPATDAEPQEKGGPKGPEPTRYGDWENNGRCTDF